MSNVFQEDPASQSTEGNRLSWRGKTLTWQGRAVTWRAAPVVGSLRRVVALDDAGTHIENAFHIVILPAAD